MITRAISVLKTLHQLHLPRLDLTSNRLPSCERLLTIAFPPGSTSGVLGGLVVAWSSSSCSPTQGWYTPPLNPTAQIGLLHSTVQNGVNWPPDVSGTTNQHKKKTRWAILGPEKHNKEAHLARMRPSTVDRTCAEAAKKVTVSIRRISLVAFGIMFLLEGVVKGLLQFTPFDQTIRDLACRLTQPLFASLAPKDQS